MFFGLEKKHIRTLNLVLIIIFGVSLGHLFTTFSALYLNRSAPSQETPSSQTGLSLRKPAFKSYQSIMAVNLFDLLERNKPESQLAENPSPQEQKPVPVNVVLLGTVAARHHPIGVFLINREEQFLHLGEEIPGGGTLEEVGREEVRIRDKNGKLYTLTVPGSAAEPAPPGSTTADPSSKGGGVMDGIKEVAENRWIITSQTADDVKANMGDILKQARLEPLSKDGQVEGFRVAMLRPQTLLWALGLKQGDVVREINGIPLDSAEKALQVFQQVKEAKKISVVLQRKDEHLSFEYEVE